MFLGGACLKTWWMKRTKLCPKVGQVDFVSCNTHVVSHWGGMIWCWFGGSFKEDKAMYANV